MHEPRRFGVSEFGVGVDADAVAHLGVGRHLGAALPARPFFCGAYKPCADSLHSVGFVNVPSLKIADVVRIAILSLPSDAGLEKPDELSASRVGHGDELAVRMLDDAKHLVLMVFLLDRIPKQLPEPKPLAQIALRERPDGYAIVSH